MAVVPRGGSQYEDYNSTSSTYDTGRQAIGVEVILGALTYAAEKLQSDVKKIRLLDAGCGTGNYSKALCPFVAKVIGLEHSEGMLEKARMKTEDLNNVEVLQGDITDMPFPNEHFDGVIINQVLHHLTRHMGDLSQVDKFFEEAHRVIVPKGALIINTCSKYQTSNTIWFYNVLPKVEEVVIERLPPIDYILSTLVKVGFSVGGVYALKSENYIKPEVYLQKEGPLKPSWRNMDSTWSLATPAELEAGLQQWKEKIANGEADKIIADCEENRKKLGMTTSIIAYKL